MISTWARPVPELFVIVLAISAACSGAERSEERQAGVWAIDRATVLFTASRAGNSDLYLHVPDLGEPRRLTTDTARDNYGQISPDGRAIAFQSRRTGAIDIFVLEVATGIVTNLTDDAAFDVLPTWSPDGRQLAFMSTRGYELGTDLGPFPGHIYLIDVGGSNLRQLTKDPLTSSLGPQAWSPDGNTILLSRNAGGGPDLFALDVETGAETRLTQEAAGIYGASFSHDGARVAFHVEADDSSQIVVMDVDGQNRRTVTRGAGFRYNPRWSPDDAWLLVTAQQVGREDWDLIAVRVRDGHERPIIATPEDEREGVWADALAR